MLAVAEKPKQKLKEIQGIASGSEAFLEGFAAGVRPLPDQNVWQWADEHRIIAGSVAAEPGPYRTDRTPYLRKIMEALSPQSETKIVVCIKATQLGLTEAGNNWAGHTVDINPCSMAMYFPTDGDAGKHSKLKFQPSAEATPVLREKLIDNAQSKADKTIMTKVFPGGSLNFLGAESPRNFRHMSWKHIMGDEIDEWPFDVGGQGDPTELLINRMDTFSQAGGKLYLLSTPTLHKLSKIERWWDDSDQQHLYLPCPLCGEFQILVWKQLKYKKTSREEGYTQLGTPEYECIHCEKRFGEHHKTAMLAAHDWRAHKPGRKIEGFFIHSMYSPLGWLSWSDMVDEWLRAHKDMDVTKRKRFINTRLGEVWKEDVEVHDPHALAKRREVYAAEVPAGACLLTAATDVQKDRLEVEVKAWGPGYENWGIEHKIIYGSPTHADTWKKHDEYIYNTEFQHESGLMLKIRGAGLDTGYETDICYDYLKERPGIFALKGKGGDRATITGPNKDKRTNVKLYTVGTDSAKERIFGWLSLNAPGPGYCHFPKEYDDDYFDELTGEVAIFDKGRRKFVPRRAGQEVEALDLFVYNRAVLEILRPNLDREMKRLLRRVAQKNRKPEPKGEIRRQKPGKKKPFATSWKG